ncbi:hypothetical protein LINGRAHAP2_LOCUS29118 [Linum grandiflorum]
MKKENPMGLLDPSIVNRKREEIQDFSIPHPQITLLLLVPSPFLPPSVVSLHVIVLPDFQLPLQRPAAVSFLASQGHGFESSGTRRRFKKKPHGRRRKQEETMLLLVGEELKARIDSVRLVFVV